MLFHTVDEKKYFFFIMHWNITLLRLQLELGDVCPLLLPLRPQALMEFRIDRKTII